MLVTFYLALFAQPLWEPPLWLRVPAANVLGLRDTLDEHCTSWPDMRADFWELSTLPPWHERLDWPSPAWSEALMGLSEKYQQFLAGHMQSEPDRAEQYRLWIQELDRRWSVYDSLRDANCRFYTLAARRRALREFYKKLLPLERLYRQPPDLIPVELLP